MNPEFESDLFWSCMPDGETLLPMFRDLMDGNIAAPFFNKWKWLPHTDTNEDSGIFVRCNPEYDDCIVDLPERIPVRYGMHRADVDMGSSRSVFERSFVRDVILPHDNFVVPSTLGDFVNVSMRFGKLCGTYVDLQRLYTLFCDLRQHVLDKTVKHKIAYGAVQVSWQTYHELVSFVGMFASAFYEWDTPWN